MTRRLPVCLACAVLLVCREPTAADGSSLQSQGLRRTYALYLPRGADTIASLPLLLAFHGAGGTGADLERSVGLDQLADRYGFAIVYPDATAGDARHTWALGCAFCTWADVAGVDDYQFVRDLVRNLRDRSPIDTTRLFAAGVSLGGSFAHDLACHDPALLAGTAVVAAMPSADELPLCQQATRSLVVLLMLGDQDPNVPVGGGGQYDYRSAEWTAALWAARDTCSGAAAHDSLPDRDQNGRHVLTTTYSLCAAPGSVRLFIIEGGGHSWPTGDLDASAEIARSFFSR